MAQDSRPTEELIQSLQLVFDYFNAALFDDQLPPCILTFAVGNSPGFFVPKGWQKGPDEADQITLNPTLLQQPVEAITAKLVREMVNLWQHTHGHPARRGYYNYEWSGKMELIGLIPSDTGEPGGRKVGQGIQHYVDPDGQFAKALDGMLAAEEADAYFPWKGRGTALPRKPACSKVKYTCPVCGLNMWGKPGIKAVKCFEDNCDAALEQEGAESLAEPHPAATDLLPA